MLVGLKAQTVELVCFNMMMVVDFMKRTVVIIDIETNAIYNREE